MKELSSERSRPVITHEIFYSTQGGVWSVQIEIKPLTSASYISRNEREHLFSSDTQLSLMAPRLFLSHTLITASAGGRHLMRGWYISVGSRRLEEGMDAAKFP